MEMIVAEIVWLVIFGPIIAYLFAKIIGMISKDGMTIDENIVFKISSITNSGEIKLTARREFPGVLDYLGSLLLGKISLEITQDQETIEIDYSMRGTTITSLIPNEQISSVAYGSRRYVVLRNISIVIMAIVIVLASYTSSDPTVPILISLLVFIAYLIFRTSVLEIQASGGKKILFRFSGDAEINGLSDFSKAIVGGYHVAPIESTMNHP
mgnify:CR=1 FL=1